MKNNRPILRLELLIAFLSVVLILFMLILLPGCGSGGSSASIPVSGGGSSSGTTETVSRSQAETIIKEQVINTLPQIKDTRAYISQDTLKPGDVVTSIDDGEISGEAPLVIESESWLAMVDPYPRSLFAHDVEWVLTDAKSGEIQRIPRTWYPRINGVAIWVVSDERFDGPDQFYPETVTAGSPGYRSFDSQRRGVSETDAFIRGLEDAPGKNGVRKVGMVINGAFHNGTAQENGGDHTLALMANALSQNDFEMNTNGEANEFFADVNDPDAPEKAAEKVKNVAAGLGPCDKFYLVILSHGAEDGSGVQIGKEGYGFYYDPAKTPPGKTCLATLLADLPAGTINVTILACYSGNAITPLVVEMATHGNKPGVINTAAMSTRAATDAGPDPQFGEPGMPYGNDFANELGDKSKNDLNKDGDVDIQELEQAMKRAHDVAKKNFWVNLMGNNPVIDYFGGHSPW